MVFPPPKLAVISSAAAVAVGTVLLITTHDEHHQYHNLHHLSHLLNFLHSGTDAVSSWLTPPYLYLLVNAIIISILASAKIHSRAAAASRGDVLDIGRRRRPPSLLLETDGRNSSIGADEIKGLEKGVGEEGEVYAPAPPVLLRDRWDDSDGDHHRDTVAPPPELGSPTSSGEATNFTPSKGGGRKAAGLGISNSKSARRNDTLDSTWNMITDGRHVPITRHLKKSDTWSSSHVSHPSAAAGKAMKESETFIGDAGKAAGSAAAAGKVVRKRGPSLSQEELNRRVEAFINNFNEEMRLQRQESLNRYKESLRGGEVFSF
ncbi:unnamed protein product [Linum trigynum]|uniref:DUF4408 domain-containing protein n=1 Tax=Linum trigynum TaxID=586398 RepID=A0AAV2EIR6_9ROSI